MSTKKSNIRKEVSVTPVSIDTEKGVYESEFQKKNTLSVMLRQSVTTTAFYPPMQVETEFQDNVFALADYGLEEEGLTSTEKRVAFLNVPLQLEGVPTTVEAVMKKIPKTACLYRIKSSFPIISDNQKYAIDEGLRTMDDYANDQVLRYPEGATNKEGEDVSEELVLDEQGKAQYRAVFFYSTHKEDRDLRNNSADEFYSSEEILAEMTKDASVIQGQSLV